MSDVRLPNAELLLSAFWRQDTIIAGIFADNVFTELPARFSGPWPAVRISRLGGAADQLAVVDHPFMQIDVWGGPKTLAYDGAAALRAALAQRLPWRLPSVGSIALHRLGSLRYFPDVAFDPARPRYIFDAQLVTRPAQ